MQEPVRDWSLVPSAANIKSDTSDETSTETETDDSDETGRTRVLPQNDERSPRTLCLTSLFLDK